MAAEKHEFTLVHLPTPEKLTDEQEAYWWEQLEIAERKVEYARRMLKIGRFAANMPPELGLDG